MNLFNRIKRNPERTRAAFYQHATSLVKKARKARIELLLGFLAVLASVLFIAILWRGFDWPGANWVDCWLGTSQLEAPKWEAIKTLSQALFGTAIAFGIYVAYRRVLASDNANEQQVFNEATAKLGDGSASVRLGGIYALDKLAGSNKDYLTRIAEILCAHLRETTQQKSYQAKYKDKPSNEIQSLVKVLSKLNEELSVANSRKEKNENIGFLRLDLSASYLVGTDLGNACLKYVNLMGTNLQMASLDGAQMRMALLSRTQMQGAILWRAQMQMATLNHAQMQMVPLFDVQMQGASLEGAQMQGAYLEGAQMQEASLEGAQMQEARLWRAQMQGADLREVQMQGAFLHETRMQGASLEGAQMQGANLQEAQMQGAYLQKVQMQGADLYQAQMQGAILDRTQMQGTMLRETQMQGAKLSEVDLRGAYAPSSTELPYHLPKRIRKRQKRQTDLTTVIFSGGLKQEEARRIKEELIECQKNGWMPKEEVKRIIAILEEHQGKPANHEPPNGIKTGSYDKGEAEAIIAES